MRPPEILSACRIESSLERFYIWYSHQTWGQNLVQTLWSASEKVRQKWESFTVNMFCSSWLGMAPKSCTRIVYTDTVSIAQYFFGVQFDKKKNRLLLSKLWSTGSFYHGQLLRLFYIFTTLSYMTKLKRSNVWIPWTLGQPFWKYLQCWRFKAFIYTKVLMMCSWINDVRLGVRYIPIFVSFSTTLLWMMYIPLSGMVEPLYRWIQNLEVRNIFQLRWDKKVKFQTSNCCFLFFL